MLNLPFQYNRIFKLTLTYLIIFSLIGCTSMVKMDHADPQKVAEIKIGDHLLVYEKSGRVSDFIVAYADETKVRGNVVQSGKSQVNTGEYQVEINWQDITKLEIEKPDGAKTILAIAGGIVLIPVIVLGGFIVLLAAAESGW